MPQILRNMNTTRETHLSKSSDQFFNHHIQARPGKLLDHFNLCYTEPRQSGRRKVIFTDYRTGQSDIYA